MRKVSRLSKLPLLAVLGFLLVPALATAFIPTEESNRQAALSALVAGSFGSPDLEVQPSLEVQPRGSRKALENPSLQRFFAFQSEDWEVRWDTRSNRPNLIQGAGIPLPPAPSPGER